MKILITKNIDSNDPMYIYIYKDLFIYRIHIY